MTDCIMINLLVGLVSVLIGIGGSHTFVLKKIEMNAINIAKTQRDIVTVFENNRRVESRVDTCHEMHIETLGLIKETILALKRSERT